MLIGSNNSLTYLRPSSWWSKIFKWFGRCQSSTYIEQYEYCGVRLFDLKLYADEHCHIIIKNGKYKYSIFSLFEILNYLNKKGDATVNISFDASLDDVTSDVEYDRIEDKFLHMCKIIETVYPNIQFLGGRRTYDKKVMYLFENERVNGIPIIINKSYNSWIYKAFPVLIGIKNRRNIKKYEKEDCFLLLNFVDRR